MHDGSNRWEKQDVWKMKSQFDSFDQYRYFNAVCFSILEVLDYIIFVAYSSAIEKVMRIDSIKVCFSLE